MERLVNVLIAVTLANLVLALVFGINFFYDYGFWRAVAINVSFGLAGAADKLPTS